MHTILILAPHQDDECLQTAGVIKRAVAAGDSVHVCFATNGEYEGEEFAAIRAAESRSVLKTLGVPPEHIRFLGYADTGMPYEDSFLQRLYREPETPLRSRWGRGETWTPDGGDDGYRRRGVHSPYTAAGIRRDLEAVLSELLPDEIYVSAPGDCHGDHDALGRFTEDAVEALGGTQPDWKPALFYYLVHGDAADAWPDRTAAEFSLPDGWDGLWREEHRPLPSRFSPAEKRALLLRYASQKPEAYEGFLLAFARNEELLLGRTAH